MQGRVRLSIASFLAASVALVVATYAAPALAQQITTTYGQDPVPGAGEQFEHWHAYGSDPVPKNRIDNSGYVWAYGLDPVPGTPFYYDQPQDQVPSLGPDQILPNQTLQVLTGDVEGGGRRPCEPSSR